MPVTISGSSEQGRIYDLILSLQRLKLWFQHEYRNKPNRGCYEHQKKCTSRRHTHTASTITYTTWPMYSTDY